jgi:hypothetical protein
MSSRIEFQSLVNGLPNVYLAGNFYLETGKVESTTQSAVAVAQTIIGKQLNHDEVK